MPNDNQFLRFFFPAVFAGAGAILLLIAFIIYRVNAGKRKTCTVQSNAVVYKMEKRRSSLSLSDPRVNMTAWIPTYEYTVNGETKRKQSAMGYTRKRFEEGQIVTLCYDPQNPDRVYVPEEHTAGIYVLLCGIGIAFLGMGFLALRGMSRL